MLDLAKLTNEELFHEWLKTVLERKFEFYDNSDCLFASWAKECGGQNIFCCGFGITTSDSPYFEFKKCDWLNDANRAVVMMLERFFTGEQARQAILARKEKDQTYDG